MLDQASSNGPRPRAGARDGDEGLYSSGNEGSIGVVAHPPVDEPADDATEVTPHEGEVNARGTLRDKSLCHGLTHGNVTPGLDPDIAHVAIRPLVDGDVHTANVGSSSLPGTQVETLRDDGRVFRDVRWLAFVIDEDLDVGGHGGSTPYPDVRRASRSRHLAICQKPHLTEVTLRCPSSLLVLCINTLLS